MAWKDKIIQAIKEQWIEDFGDLNREINSSPPNGYLIAGFVGTVLDKLTTSNDEEIEKVEIDIVNDTICVNIHKGGKIITYFKETTPAQSGEELSEDFKAKIDSAILKEYPEFTLTEKEHDALKWAKVGSELAKPEIERLKSLLKRVVTRNYSEVHQDYKEETWLKFKAENNL